MKREPSYRAITAGATAKANGRHFERIIESACREYSARGIAEIEKTPEPFRVERHIGGGKFIGHYEHAAQPDYKGALKSGQTIVIEAKHTARDRISRKAVTEEQSKALNRYQRMQAACYVLVSFGFTHFYMVPWDVWTSQQTADGRAYIKPNDIEAWRVPWGGGMLDFLTR